jgi:CheY-like chemotaxis protein
MWTASVDRRTPGVIANIHLGMCGCQVNTARDRIGGKPRAPAMTKGQTSVNKPLLYLFDKSSSSLPVKNALRATGYEIVSASSVTHAIALLFLIRSVAAVVLDDELRQHARIDVARRIRAVCADVLIILLSRYEINLPPGIDACVSAGQSPENVTSAVRHLLNNNCESDRNRGCGPLQRVA